MDINEKIKDFYVFSEEYNHTEHPVYDDAVSQNRTDKAGTLKHMMKKKKVSSRSAFNSMILCYFAYWMVMIPMLYFAGKFLVRLILMVIEVLYN